MFKTYWNICKTQPPDRTRSCFDDSQGLCSVASVQSHPQLGRGWSWIWSLVNDYWCLWWRQTKSKEDIHVFLPVFSKCQWWLERMKGTNYFGLCYSKPWKQAISSHDAFHILSYGSIPWSSWLGRGVALPYSSTLRTNHCNGTGRFSIFFLLQEVHQKSSAFKPIL